MKTQSWRLLTLLLPSLQWFTLLISTLAQLVACFTIKLSNFAKDFQDCRDVRVDEYDSFGARVAVVVGDVVSVEVEVNADVGIGGAVVVVVVVVVSRDCVTQTSVLGIAGR